MINMQSFCPVEDYRQFLLFPTRSRGYLFASNGRVAIRVADDSEVVAYPCNELDDEKKRLDLILTKVLDGCKYYPLINVSDIVVPSIACKECDGSGKVDAPKKQKCIVCGGRGEFYYEGHDYECKTCDGDGLVEVSGSSNQLIQEDCQSCINIDRDTKVFVGDYPIELRNMKLIATLPNVKISTITSTTNLGFVFDGGIGAVAISR